MFHARLFFLYHKRSIIGSYTLFYAFQSGLNNYLAAFFSRYRDAITYHFRVMCIRIIVYARWSIYVYITFHDKMHGHVYLVDWTIKFYIVEYYIADSSNAKNPKYLFFSFSLIRRISTSYANYIHVLIYLICIIYEDEINISN